MNKKQKILTKARELIRTGKEKYICEAIFKSSNSKQAFEIEKYIEKSLGFGYCGCYEDWMEYHHPGVFKKMDKNNFREARIFWIDHMINIVFK